MDEAFMDFVSDEKKHTLIWEAQHNGKLIVLRTCTKFFGLPGLRFGYLIAALPVIKKLQKKQLAWSVNCFAQAAVEAALGDKEYIENSRLFVEKEKTFLYRQLQRLKDFTPFPSVANFMLVRIESPKFNSKFLAKTLLENWGILVRDCSNFRGLNERFIRVAVRSRKDNLRLLAALKAVSPTP
jgi:threonine-phosphate decarboxylase